MIRTLSAVDFEIRDARDDDSLDLIGLVARCWSQYPGCVLDVHGEEPDLLLPHTAFRQRGDRLWVASANERLVGSAGLRRSDGAAFLVKLYVDPTIRRMGLGTALVGRVEQEARSHGHTEIELWTDTRFEDAHHLYEHLGYRRLDDTRELGDLSDTVEYHYTKSLEGATTG